GIIPFIIELGGYNILASRFSLLASRFSLLASRFSLLALTFKYFIPLSLLIVPIGIGATS
ncbi:hypothetical protein, partial [Vibrio scophthalmi]